MAPNTILAELENKKRNSSAAKQQKLHRRISVICELEISEQDLEKMNNKFREFDEAKRRIESSLSYLNYSAQLLDPTWQGWRMKSFSVNASP